MKAKLLIVDDNPALAGNLREILSDAGYQVQVARNTSEALACAEHGFDVALVDMRLPDGVGTVLTEKLRALSPESAVVLLAGFAALDTAIAAVRAGAFAYLIKPCATPELLLTVEQALRQVRMHVEKRELSRRALVAEKLAAVGTMTAGLSHEIRNPLNSATLQLAVLERRVRKLPEEQQGPLLEPLLLVRNEIRRLEHLMLDFLEFARPAEVRAQPVALHLVVSSVLQLLRGDAERNGVQLISAVPEQLPLAAGDPERLGQVVMNLVLNALQAVHAGDSVRVTASSASDSLFLAIDDTGPGIAPEARKRLFEPFFTTKPTGSGLGLSIVHAIVTQHGGQISVEESPFGGARFVVRLLKSR